MATIQSIFLRLPREVRDQILAYAVFAEHDFVGPWVVDFQSWHDMTQEEITPPFRILPDICVASRQLYWEATPFFLQAMTLLSHDAETTSWVAKWLATFPSNQGFSSIRRIEFRNFHGSSQVKAYEFVALCPNLRELSFKFGIQNADPTNQTSIRYEMPNQTGRDDQPTHEIIFSVHGLNKVLELPKLTKFTFGFHNWVELWYKRVPWNLLNLLKEKVEKKGMSLDVVCIHQSPRDENTDDEEDMCCSAPFD